VPAEPALRTLLVVELAIVALLFVLLLAWPIVRRALAIRKARQRDALLEALDAGKPPGGDPDPVRSALARCRPASLLRVLEELEDRPGEPDHPDLRDAVRDSPAFGRIERAARSRLWWRRQTAAHLLGRLAREETDRPLVLSLLGDSHPAVFAAALLASRRLRWPSLAEPLLDRALERGEVHRGEQEVVIDTLGALEVDPVPLLRSRLGGAGDLDVELPLLRIAGRLGDRRLRPYLLRRLREGGREIRIQAAKTLGTLGDPGGVDALREALEDPAWQVRTQAARALGELAAGGAADDLRRSLSDPSWWVRLRAALALRKLGPRGREILAAVDPGADRYAAEMARYVLELDAAAIREYGR
jgi:HEAT repeat protein